MSGTQQQHAEGNERRLAAIVFTDVTGYSARMQRDETGTLALVQADFVRMRELCAQHGGEVLKSTGDGLLLCFASVAAAVTCALQIQAEFGPRGPAALQHRIGIHLGDVFRKDGDVAGDGVNIAARLQTKARPGTICLSQSVYDAVKGKLPMHAESLGPQLFKNIAEPVAVYLVVPAGAVLSAAGKKIPAVWIAAAGLVAVALLVVVFWPKLPAPGVAAVPVVPVADRSIAVLPFTNMSEDKDNAYFADGVHEDVLTQLALIGELRVTSRTSVAEYRKTTKNIRQIAAELGVAHILEGSVRRTGGQVRVTAQLIEARTDRHLWARTYDRELKDVFAIQAELAAEIAGALQATLSPQVRSALSRYPTQNMAAYELLLRQQAANTKDSIKPPDIQRNIELLQQAVELDPGLAIAWARLGTMHARKIFDFQDISPEQQARARQAIERARELAPTATDVRLEEGNYHYYAHRDYARAEAIYEEILRAAPHNIEALSQMGFVLRREGRFRESNAYLDKVLAQDPRHVRALGNKYYNFIRIRDFSGAKMVAGRLGQLQPAELSFQVQWHETEWLRTGRFESYDAWRAQQAPGVEKKSDAVARFDLCRALARRDFATAEDLLTLLRAGPRLTSMDAQLQLAKGDRDAARRAASEAMREVKAALQVQPDQPRLLVEQALLHALLGEREPALRIFQHAQDLIPESRDVFQGADVALYAGPIHALLGDRDVALGEIRQFLLAPSFVSGFAVKTDLRFAPLWSDPGFIALADDPASNGLLQ